MPLTSPRLLHELLKLVVVVLVAAVVGLGLGVGLNKVFGTSAPVGTDARPATRAPASTPAATTPTTTPAATTTGSTAVPAPPSVQISTSSLDLGAGLTLRIASASVVAATKPTGKAGNRGRLVIRASVRNAGSATATPPVQRLVLRFGTAVVRPDPAAGGVAGALLQPLAPGATATGELHFETHGTTTTALTAARSVLIRFGPRALVTPVG